MGEDKLANVKLTSKDRFKVKHFIKDLEKHSGRGTELVSVYVPAGYDLAKIVQHLQSEQGTASNIKSSATRNNVTNALERMIQHLKLIEKTPPNGIAAFSGNVSEREGQPDIQVFSLEPPIPNKLRLYRCEKQFIIEPLKEIVDDENVFGMIVIDKREGDVALLKGKAIIPLSHSQSAVPGKHKSGGQCLAPDTQVLMASGAIKEIQYIQSGESVIAYENGSLQESLVLDRWESVKSTTYTIRTKNPSFMFTCSGDHLCLKRESAGLVYRAAEELVAGDWLTFPEQYSSNPSVERFPHIEQVRYELSSTALTQLQDARKTKQLSQKAISEYSGLAQSTISAFERGVLQLPWNTLLTLLPYYGVGQEQIIAKREVIGTLPYCVTPEIARFVGFFTGDGFIDQTRMGLCEQREAVARAYAALIEHVFKISPTIEYREKKHYWNVRVCLGELLSGFFGTFPELLERQRAVPQAILTAGDEAVAQYLRGLFDAEASVSVDKIGIAMANKQLMQSSQIMLLRFGIIGSLLPKSVARNPYNGRPQVALQITDRTSLERFETLIGFTSEEKQQRLQRLITRKSEMNKVRQVLASGNSVRELVESHGKNRELFPAVNNFFREERGISKDAFARSIVSQTTGSLQLELAELLTSPLLPVQIASIKRNEGSFPLVDIAVESHNFIANGVIVHNSAARFERLRDGAAKEFYRRVAEHAHDSFFPIRAQLQGILLGGPGTSKEEFLEQGDLTQELKDKIIATKDLSYTGDFGLQELLEKCEDVLSAEEVVEEKRAMQKFFMHLAKNTGHAAYGREAVLMCIQMGAVDMLLLSESLSDEDIEFFSTEADKLKTNVMLVSLATREGAQLKEMGRFAAILRYPVET